MQTENLILSRVRVKSIHQRLFRKQMNHCTAFLTSTEQSFMGEKFSLQAPEWPFFTIILTILLLFLQIIVLRAHIEGYWSIFNSMEFYFPPSQSIHIQFTVTTSMIHPLPSWSTNRWNTASYGLFLLIPSPLFCFHLPPSSAKVDSVHLQSTGPRCRFQLCGYSG